MLEQNLLIRFLKYPNSTFIDRQGSYKFISNLLCVDKF